MISVSAGAYALGTDTMNTREATAHSESHSPRVQSYLRTEEGVNEGGAVSPPTCTGSERAGSVCPGNSPPTATFGSTG